MSYIITILTNIKYFFKLIAFIIVIILNLVYNIMCLISQINN